ncbi:MAG: hypothetical protein IT280_05070 [Ignavibacteria bacterium]|nr:hypothetical protein [Ignavibacteria bacterium]
MSRKLHLFVFLLIFCGIFNNSYSQFLPSFAFAGGVTAGWHFNPVKNLNIELKNAGFPEFSENGFLTLGGGGFIDLPMKDNFLRIGGFGNGFTSKISKHVNDSLTKDANYSLGQGGISVEYVFPVSKLFDISFGTQFSTGTLKLELYQYGKDFGNYSSIFGELQNNSSTENISRTFKSRFYTIQPMAGVGIMLRKFMYLKIDCGYQIGVQNKWRVDNDVEVKDFPKGIEAKGLFVNVGLNFGLFIRD